MPTETLDTLVLDAGQDAATNFSHEPFSGVFVTVFDHHGTFSESLAEQVVLKWVGSNRLTDYLYDLIAKVSSLFLQVKPPFVPRVLVIIDERLITSVSQYSKLTAWLRSSRVVARPDRPAGMICVLVSDDQLVSDREETYRLGVDLVITLRDCRNLAYLQKRVLGAIWLAKAQWHDQAATLRQAIVTFIIAFVWIPIFTGVTLHWGETLGRWLLAEAIRFFTQTMFP